MRYFAYITSTLIAMLLLSAAVVAAQDGYPPVLKPPADDQTMQDSATPTEEPAAQEQPEQAAPTEEAQPAQPQTTPATQPAAQGVQPTQPKESETGLDEYIWEENQRPATPQAGVPGQPGQPSQPGAVKVTGQRKLTIDAVVVVNYKFAKGTDSYNIKYHVNMGGMVPADVGMIKGNAKVATDIGGFLAKSSAFECLLRVSIADIPYEIMFKKLSDKEADINVAFKGQILEDWESLCTFLEGAKFNTRGLPEKWIGVALEKAKPPLTKLIAPIDPTKTTTLKFAIPKHTVDDEGLGSAEVEGTGVVTIQPAVQPAVVPASQQLDETKKMLENE